MAKKCRPVVSLTFDMESPWDERALEPKSEFADKEHGEHTTSLSKLEMLISPFKLDIILPNNIICSNFADQQK